MAEEVELLEHHPNLGATAAIGQLMQAVFLELVPKCPPEPDGPILPATLPIGMLRPTPLARPEKL